MAQVTCHNYAQNAISYKASKGNGKNENKDSVGIINLKLLKKNKKNLIQYMTSIEMKMETGKTNPNKKLERTNKETLQNNESS